MIFNQGTFILKTMDERSQVPYTGGGYPNVFEWDPLILRICGKAKLVVTTLHDNAPQHKHWRFCSNIDSKSSNNTFISHHQNIK